RNSNGNNSSIGTRGTTHDERATCVVGASCAPRAASCLAFCSAATARGCTADAARLRARRRSTSAATVDRAPTATKSSESAAAFAVAIDDDGADGSDSSDCGSAGRGGRVILVCRANKALCRVVGDNDDDRGAGGAAAAARIVCSAIVG